MEQGFRSMASLHAQHYRALFLPLRAICIVSIACNKPHHHPLTPQQHGYHSQHRIWSDAYTSPIY